MREFGREKRRGEIWKEGGERENKREGGVREFEKEREREGERVWEREGGWGILGERGGGVGESLRKSGRGGVGEREKERYWDRE